MTFEQANDAAGGQGSQNSASSRLLEEANNLQFRSSATRSPIDEKTELCEDKARSTSDSIACANTAKADWDLEMNRAYKTLQKEETPEEKQALLNAQRQWLKFRDKESESIGHIYLGDENHPRGSMYYSFAAYADADVVKDRAIELENRAGNDANGSYADRINVPFDCEATYADRLGEAYDRADAALNKNYQALMQRLDKPAQDALRESERSWLEFRDAEFELIDTSTDSRYKGPRIQALQAKVDIVKTRADHLEHQLHVGPEG
jgi:uncharacterized protein YecT (DUF1311 family)